MSEAPTVTEFVGVYDADSTLLGEVSYWIGARLGTRHCSLCELTHGLFTLRSEWKECRRSLSVHVSTYHRNDAPADVLEAASGVFPVVLARTSGALTVVLWPGDLEEFHGDTALFAARLEAIAHGAD
ncbi:MAG: hypothetical protein ACKO1X_06220 [Acidimicrobiales bacterium]